MNISPFPSYYDGCVPQVPVTKYRPPRVTISPDTRHIVVDIDRGMNAGFFTQQEQLQFVLELTRNDHTVSFPSIVVQNYQAHFDVSNSTAMVERGLYEGQVKFRCQCIGRVQVVKAPSFSVGGAGVIESECASNNWVEPAFKQECPPEDECECETVVECEPCKTPTPCTDSRKNHGLKTRRGYGY